MHFLVRPSKIFLFDRLDSLLRKETGEIGVDAAADRLRNRHFFRTRYYYGLDKNKVALLRGLRSHPDNNTFGIEANIVDLRKMPDNIADVVLSSNTLYWLPGTERAQAVRELCRITAPKGLCILEFKKDEQYPQMLNSIADTFLGVRVFYFRNPISRAYEHLAYTEEKKERPFFTMFFMRTIAWCLARLEYLTCRSRLLNRHAVVIARTKRVPVGERAVFGVERLRRTGERLYSAMT